MFDRTRYDWYPTVFYNGVAYSATKVVKSDGSPRPALKIPLNVFTVHYGGAGQWLDPGDTALELAAIERNHAIPQRKPNEYNSASDSDALTWEWAGRFQAAHSEGENATAWGHLCVLGLEQPTEAQADKLIEGIRKARAQCVAAGWLHPAHVVEAHQNMPGAQTNCPGPLYDNKRWWNRIIAPLTTPPEPPAGYERIAVMNTFEAATATRWDTRGFAAQNPALKNGLGAGEYVCKLDGSPGKIGATVNLTIVGGPAAGYASAWKEGPRPESSKVNYGSWQAVANEVFVPLAADGSFRIYIHTQAHIIVDLVGYWT